MKTAENNSKPHALARGEWRYHTDSDLLEVGFTDQGDSIDAQGFFRSFGKHASKVNADETLLDMTKLEFFANGINIKEQQNITVLVNWAAKQKNPALIHLLRECGAPGAELAFHTYSANISQSVISPTPEQGIHVNRLVPPSQAGLLFESHPSGYDDGPRIRKGR